MLIVNCDLAASILYILIKLSSPADKTRDDKTLSLSILRTVLNNIENGPIGD